MNVIRIIKGAAVALAGFGIVLPPGQLFADAPQQKAPAANVSRIPDLKLSDEGTMTGRVVDHSGKDLEGAKVVLKQGKKQLAETISDANGRYEFKNLKTGMYNVGSGNTEGVFRTWSKKAAPPSAKEVALLVMGENGARGQFGSVDPTLVILTAGVIAAVALSAVAVADIQSVKRQVDNLSASP